MIYTLGHTKNYDEGLKKYGNKFCKTGKIKDYKGGYALKTIKDANKLIGELNKVNEYSIYAVGANWEKDTVKTNFDWWHYLIKTSIILYKMKEN